MCRPVRNWFNDHKIVDNKNLYSPRMNYLDSETPNANSGSKVRHILLFTKYYGKEDWPIEMGSAAFEECPVSNCFVTKDRQDLSSLSEFDAILFHYSGGQFN